MFWFAVYLLYQFTLLVIMLKPSELRSPVRLDAIGFASQIDRYLYKKKSPNPEKVVAHIFWFPVTSGSIECGQSSRSMVDIR